MNLARPEHVIGTIKWRDDDLEGDEFASVDDLIGQLRAIARESTKERGIAAVLGKPSDQSMTVIMAGPHWGLDWFPENYQGLGSYHAVAQSFDPDTDTLPGNPEIATYYIFGHHSEIPLQYTIPEELAIVAVREFFSSPDRPLSLKWELD